MANSLSVNAGFLFLLTVFWAGECLGDNAQLSPACSMGNQLGVDASAPAGTAKNKWGIALAAQNGPFWNQKAYALYFHDGKIMAAGAADKKGFRGAQEALGGIKKDDILGMQVNANGEWMVALRGAKPSVITGKIGDPSRTEAIPLSLHYATKNQAAEIGSDFTPDNTYLRFHSPSKWLLAVPKGIVYPVPGHKEGFVGVFKPWSSINPDAPEKMPATWSKVNLHNPLITVNNITVSGSASFPNGTSTAIPRTGLE